MSESCHIIGAVEYQVFAAHTPLRGCQNDQLPFGCQAALEEVGSYPHLLCGT